MSWATHDLEPYVIQRKLGLAVAIVPLLVGSYSPDIFTKWFVYGFDFLGIHAQAGDPESFHRSWPGVGFTHSLGVRRRSSRGSSTWSRAARSGP